MKLWKGILLGSAAGLTSAASGLATDLQGDRAAPIDYVRICDASGAAFFFIPGTDTCLEIGGSTLARRRGRESVRGISGSNFLGTGTPRGVTGVVAGAGTSSNLRWPEAISSAGRAPSFFTLYADAYMGLGTGPSMGVDGATSGSPAIAAPAGLESAPGGQGVPQNALGNPWLDQPWGAAQLSGAAQQVRADLFADDGLPFSPTQNAFAAVTTNAYGFTVRGGVQLNLDYLAPGDKLWLQAAYEKGAHGPIAGNTSGLGYGPVGETKLYGSAASPLDYASGWNPRINADCVWTGSPTCERKWSWNDTGTLRHYWLPTLSSYQEVHYSPDALAGFGGGIGVSKLEDTQVGTLLWAPLKGFNLGAEFMYLSLSKARPAEPVPNIGVGSLTAAGLPKFQGTASEYEGRLRVQRAF